MAAVSLTGHGKTTILKGMVAFGSVNVIVKSSKLQLTFIVWQVITIITLCFK